MTEIVVGGDVRVGVHQPGHSNSLKTRKVLHPEVYVTLDDVVLGCSVGDEVIGIICGVELGLVAELNLMLQAG